MQPKVSKENQHIEWKENWRDEYLKWICGFANAQGGKLFIGKNDDGEVVGISNARKLLEEIPNKTKDILGILVEVNLHKHAGKEYLEILVESYPYPISYKGQYHYRSGATKQELKGAALDKFLLEKQGKRWDGVLPHVKVSDLNGDAFATFRDQAAKSKRLTTETLQENNKSLLVKLHLMDGKLLTNHCVNSSSATYHGDQWVRVSILVLGDSLVQHIIDNKVVLQYEKPQIGNGNVIHYDPAVKIDGTLLKEGYISLQSESHPVEFRKVALFDLSAYAKNPKKLSSVLKDLHLPVTR